MKTYREILNESVPFSKAMFGKALTQDLEKLIDQMLNVDYDKQPKKYNTIQNKAKKEFARTRISGVDFYGFLDAYITWKKER